MLSTQDEDGRFSTYKKEYDENYNYKYILYSLQFKDSTNNRVSVKYPTEKDLYFLTIYDMYKFILNRAKSSNYVVRFLYDDFNVKWYDIDFINVEKYTIEHFGYLF